MCLRNLFEFFSLLWSCVFFPFLLLVFGCFFLLIYGYGMLLWFGYRRLLRMGISGDVLNGLGRLQKFVKGGCLSADCTVCPSFRFLSGLDLSNSGPGLLSPAGFVHCFWSISSFWIDNGLELGSGVIHLSGINNYFSGFIMCTRSDFFVLNSAPIRISDIQDVDGRHRLFGWVMFGLVNFCFCAAQLWEDKQAQVFVILWAHVWVNLDAATDHFLKAHQWVFDLWSRNSLVGLGPIRTFMYCGPSCGVPISEQVVFYYLKKALSFWVLFYKNYCLVCMLGSGSMFLIGKDIIPTRMSNTSRRCMFFVFVTNSKACFGVSSIGWRGYAPLNM